MIWIRSRSLLLKSSSKTPCHKQSSRPHLTWTVHKDNLRQCFSTALLSKGLCSPLLPTPSCRLFSLKDLSQLLIINSHTRSKSLASKQASNKAIPIIYQIPLKTISIQDSQTLITAIPLLPGVRQMETRLKVLSRRIKRMRNWLNNIKCKTNSHILTIKTNTNTKTSSSI